ncbi:hypothetical protein [Novosphingobium sp.]|uniref:hypothetical protein n=1 Tax=Novosphingobium sp. TaxID=1874826 RepID=UPI0038BB5736
MSSETDADAVRRMVQTGLAEAMLKGVQAAQAAGLDPARGSAILMTVLNDLMSGVISSLPLPAHEPLLVECNAALRRMVAMQVCGAGTVQ